MPATPMATSVVPCRQARPKESVTITGGATPKRAASASRGPRPRRPGRGEEHDPALAGRVRAVDAGAGADEAVLGLGDDESSRRRRTARASRRITAMVVGLLDASLGLGDDLLRDDDHVALGRPSGPLERVAEQRGEVVPGCTSGIPLRGTTWITRTAR